MARTKTDKPETPAEAPTSLEEIKEYIAQNSQQQTPRRTIGEQFIINANLLTTVKRETRLNETTLIKLWELGLMWALNNRNQPDDGILPIPGGEGTEGDEESSEPVIPDPHEVLEPETTPATPETE